MSESNAPASSPEGRRPCVLIVDDEVRILNSLHRTLRREGFEIVLAESPAKAMRVLEERSVDLVLTDHKMPGMTGIELLAEAARLRPSAARLMITGWAGEVPRDRIEALDVKALIPKPWDDADLKATLHRCLTTG